MVLGRNLETRTILSAPAATPPALLVVVDTEEEFDWDADFDRQATGVSAMEHLWKAQALFAEYGVKPTYVVDYPVATTPSSVAVLREFLDADAAQVGIHLHPWVNPPHEEPVNRRNSYQGNLPPELERRKLAKLTDAVREHFGFQPTIHKAGRYGFGQNSAKSLIELGYQIDLSAAPPFDFSADGGPDYSRIDALPYTFGPNGALFGIPTTGGFMGVLHGRGPTVYSARALESTFGSTLASVLSKSRTLERAMLSPEGHSIQKMRRLTRQLVQRGVRVLTMSFHSPTVKAGCTPYAATEREVTDLLDRCRQYLEFFMDELGGQPSTPHEVRQRMLAMDAHS